VACSSEAPASSGQATFYPNVLPRVPWCRFRPGSRGVAGRARMRRLPDDSVRQPGYEPNAAQFFVRHAGVIAGGSSVRQCSCCGQRRVL